MNRRPTASELAFPLDEASLAAVNGWAEEGFTMLLEWMWQAWDELHTQDLSRINLQQPLEELERDLTSNHALRITEIYARETGGYCEVTPQPEYPERESRPPPPGRSPSYDFAFVWRGNSRIAWAIEAKVVKTARELAPYLSDASKFLSGTAAPFVGQGGLIAYLISGSTEEFLRGLRPKLRAALEPVPEFPGRPHRRSRHARKKHPNITLHHMVMDCSPQMELALDGPAAR